MHVFVMKDGRENCVSLILVKILVKHAQEKAHALQPVITMQSVYAMPDSQVKIARKAVMILVRVHIHMAVP
jgi:hypothetical protein